VPLQLMEVREGRYCVLANRNEKAEGYGRGGKTPVVKITQFEASADGLVM
jgi:hypothetical protein